MRIISFNFSKITAEKTIEVKNATIDNNITFVDLKEDSLPMLKEDKILKLSYQYSLDYFNKEGEEEKKEKAAQVLFEGDLILSVSKEEAKEFNKSWKKKQVPESSAVPLYNIIFKKCGAKAVPLQEELNIPSPFLKVPQATKAQK